MRIDGYIVSNTADKELFEFFGYSATCPEDVENWLNKTKKKELYINSYGGDVFAGVEIYTTLKKHGGIDTIVDLAASIASVIMLAGKTVKISPPGQVMIHNVSSVTEGDYRDMEHAAEELKVANKAIINAYSLKTGIDEDVLQGYMDRETWLDSARAKELGFVDEILFTNKKSIYNSSLFPNLTKLRAERDRIEHKQDDTRRNAAFFHAKNQLNINYLGGLK